MTKNHTSKTISALVDQADRTGVDSLLSFEDRDDYVGFVRAWKSFYADLVAETRALKVERRDPELSIERKNAANLSRQANRHTARTLIEIRLAGKALAREHRRRALEAKAA